MSANEVVFSVLIISLIAVSSLFFLQIGADD